MNTGHIGHTREKTRARDLRRTIFAASFLSFRFRSKCSSKIFLLAYRLTVGGDVGPPVLDLEVLDEVSVEFGLLGAVASVAVPIAGVLSARLRVRRASSLTASGGNAGFGA